MKGRKREGEQWAIGRDWRRFASAHFDYRSVLAEALARILGNRDLDRVFPYVKPQPVGLVNE